VTVMRMELALKPAMRRPRVMNVLLKEPSFVSSLRASHLLHREEGIDLRLSLAATPRKCRCRGMPPTLVSSV